MPHTQCASCDLMKSMHTLHTHCAAQEDLCMMHWPISWGRGRPKAGSSRHMLRELLVLSLRKALGMCAADVKHTVCAEHRRSQPPRLTLRQASLSAGSPVQQQPCHPRGHPCWEGRGGAQCRQTGPQHMIQDAGLDQMVTAAAAVLWHTVWDMSMPFQD